MISMKKLVLNEPVYWICMNSGPRKASIVEIINDNIARVKPYYKKKEVSPKIYPLDWIFADEEKAQNAMFAWKISKRKHKKKIADKKKRAEKRKRKEARKNAEAKY